MNQNVIEQLLAYWQGLPKQEAYNMIEKYGLPEEATINRLIWHQNGRWKRTTITRYTVPHNFPTPHEDFLEQTVNYRIPVNLADDLTWFDGSVYIDRTAGEVSAKCHKEPMNILSLNLVHDIVIGKRTVDEARMFYAETAEKFTKNQQTSPYTERLLFPEQCYTNDPGISYFDS
jgi:hypothetical protein